MKKITLLLLIAFFPVIDVFANFPNSFAEIVKNEKDKVVHVLNTSTRQQQTNPFDDPFFLFPNPNPRGRPQVASGTGFFVSKDGYILTNNHVIDFVDSLEVTLSNEKSYPAEVIGKDPRTDLALIKIDIKNAPFVKFGDSDKLEIGDWVVAIGNPLGLNFTVTAGILSARNRDIFGGTAYGTFLQTDAAINEGNSGGPLFNTKGEVVGINTAIAADGQGLGFAIPSNLAVKIVKELKEHGEVQRGWLGVGIQNVSAEFSASFQIPEGEQGVAITGVQKNSPADKGGLKRGDVIVRYNEKEINKVSELQQSVAETSINSTATLKLYRDGKLITKRVKIGLAPKKPESIELDFEFGNYGLLLSPLTREVRNRRNIQVRKGLVIQRLQKNGLAEINDLRIGDVILEVNGIEMVKITDFSKAIEKTKKEQALLLIHRNGDNIFRSLPVEK